MKYSSVDLVKDNLQIWEIYVIGPPETPYDKGIYKALLEFPSEYPIKPPSIKFLSKMFHPNIYKDGKVCISTLQISKNGDDKLGVYWRPVLGIEQVVLSVVSLLSDPNLDDPANLAAANLMKKDMEAYKAQCEKLAIESWNLVPDDFVFPKLTSSTQQKKNIRKEKSETKDDDEFSYDIEDLSTLGSNYTRGKEYIFVKFDETLNI